MLYTATWLLGAQSNYIGGMVLRLPVCQVLVQIYCDFGLVSLFDS